MHAPRLCGRRNTDLARSAFPARPSIPRVTSPQRQASKEFAMTPNQPLRLLSPRDHDALHTAARLRATQLRDEAQREFFIAMRRALRRAWNALRGGPTHARC
jgi:hypothetical protein